MDALVIMAKEPVAGKVKTRLTAPLSQETAAELYTGFLFDKIAQIKTIDDTSHFIAYYPASGRGFFQKHSFDNFELIEQIGNDLGKRLNGISTELISRGFDKVMMLDSDTPNLPSSYINEGLRHLDETDIVLGPTDDGGYYLIGLKESQSAIFKDIPWSTQEVTKITREKIAGLDKSLYLLPSWYDVDTIEDLERLKSDINKISKLNSDQFLCENTIKSLNKIGNLENYHN
jgi:rSAM/selenodomain-associated transferase 1